MAASHIGCVPNELADRLAKWSCSLPPPIPPRHLPLGTLTYRGYVIQGNWKRAFRPYVCETHTYTDVDFRFSFLWSKTMHLGATQEWKWVNGLVSWRDFAPFFHLNPEVCNECHKTHAVDVISCVAYCDRFQMFRKAFVNAWGEVRSLLPNWFENATFLDTRLFFRGLVPKSTSSLLKDLKNPKTWNAYRVKRWPKIIQDLRKWVTANKPKVVVAKLHTEKAKNPWYKATSRVAPVGHTVKVKQQKVDMPSSSNKRKRSPKQSSKKRTDRAKRAKKRSFSLSGKHEHPVVSNLPGD